MEGEACESMWGANGLDRMGRVSYHKRVRETKPSKEDGREQGGERAGATGLGATPR